jgi:hypothetical protein
MGFKHKLNKGMRKMQRLLKLILISITMVAPGYCYANFEVHPQELKIHIGQKASILKVINDIKAKTFTLELIDTQTQKPTGDLSFSPAAFSLAAKQSQVVRVMTKDGVDYRGKTYALKIRTNDDNLAIPGKPNAFNIPINISGVESNNSNKQLNGRENIRSSDTGNGNDNNSRGLTQIKIPIQVTATVK